MVYLFWLSISLSIDLYSWDLFLRATPAFVQVSHQDRTKATILSSSRELVSLNLNVFLLFWRIKLLGDVLNILISKLDFFFWTCFKKKLFVRMFLSCYERLSILNFYVKILYMFFVFVCLMLLIIFCLMLLIMESFGMILRKMIFFSFIFLGLHY